MECLGESIEKRLMSYKEKKMCFKEQDIIVLMDNILRALLGMH
jgi:hypothetical protein